MLYRDLAAAADRFARRHRDLPLAWLPPSTYHVTVMDGLSAPHVAMLGPERARCLGACLDRLPRSVADLEALTLGDGAALQRLCAAVGAAPVDYRAVSIVCRGHAVLAELQPTDGSVDAHAAIERLRESTLSTLEHQTGLQLTTPWQPHVSLGYVANRQAARALAAALTEQPISADDIAEHTIRYRSAGVYGFLDMADYRRSASRRCQS